MVAAQAEIANHQRFDHYILAVDSRDRAERVRRETEQSNSSDVIGVHFWKGIGQRLVGERIDAYMKMRKIFEDRMAFADPDTQAWYDYFYAFVEM